MSGNIPLPERIPVLKSGVRGVEIHFHGVWHRDSSWRDPFGGHIQDIYASELKQGPLLPVSKDATSECKRISSGEFPE